MDSDDEGSWEVMLLERERFVDVESKSSKRSAVLKMALNSTSKSHSSYLISTTEDQKRGVCFLSLR